MMDALRVRACVCAVLSQLCLVRTAAAEGSKASCVNAFEEGQRQQLKGELERATEQFTLCADVECPALVRKECQGLLKKAGSSGPGLLLLPLESTNQLPLGGVSLAIDGGDLTPYDGRMLRLGPGEHLISLERSGYAPISLPITLRASDAPRLVRLRFTARPSNLSEGPEQGLASPSPMPGDDLPRPKASATPDAPDCSFVTGSGATELVGASPAPSQPPARTPKTTELASAPPDGQRPSSARRAAFLASGVAGGLGALGFAYFGLSARSADLGLDACTPNCQTSKVDAIKRDYFLANLSLAVGATGTVVASVLWFTLPRAEPQRRGSAASSRRWVLGLGPITTLTTKF